MAENRLYSHLNLWKVLLRSTVRGMKDLSEESSLLMETFATSANSQLWGWFRHGEWWPHLFFFIITIYIDVYWTRTILVIVNQQSKQTLVAGGVFLLVVLLLAIATIIVSGILGNLQSLWGRFVSPCFGFVFNAHYHKGHPSSDLFATGRRKLKAFQMFGTLIERLMSGWYFEKLESVWLLWSADGLGNPRYCFGSVLPWQSETTGLRL